MIIVELNRNIWFIGEIWGIINKIYGDIIQLIYSMNAEISDDINHQRQNLKRLFFLLTINFICVIIKMYFFREFNL